MNEPTNSCVDSEENFVGKFYPSNMSNSVGKEEIKKKNHFLDIPFRLGGKFLDLKTISMDAIFTDPNENSTRTYILYNIHNLYATLQRIATHKYMVSKNNKRPFIMSRDMYMDSMVQYGLETLR